MSALGGLPVELVLATTWAFLGCIAAAWLAQRGHPTAVSLAALVAWPLVLPALSDPTPPSDPLNARIDRAVDDLATTLRDPLVGWDAPGDLELLRAALRRAGERVGWIDELLASTDGSDGDSRTELVDARARAAGEVDAVLAGLTQLRLQVGLRMLQGDTTPIRARLTELHDRIQVMDEVQRLASPGVG